ncbi:hypothetical protein JG688_00017631, partial [Phytophthora aleatoria]
IEVRFLPANAPHLCQPADSFIIKSIKDLWRAEWDREKRRLQEENCFTKPNNDGKYSGKLKKSRQRILPQARFALCPNCQPARRHQQRNQVSSKRYDPMWLAEGDK